MEVLKDKKIVDWKDNRCSNRKLVDAVSNMTRYPAPEGTGENTHHSALRH